MFILSLFNNVQQTTRLYYYNIKPMTILLLEKQKRTPDNDIIWEFLAIYDNNIIDKASI